MAAGMEGQGVMGAAKATDRDVFVPLPGDKAFHVQCRLPDAATLFLHGWLPVPCLAAVEAAYAEERSTEPRWVIDPEENDLVARAEADRDRWIVAVAVAPRFVLTREEATRARLCVMDLTEDLKHAIFQATYRPALERYLADVVKGEVPELIATAPQALLLDRIAQRYRQRPSMLLGLEGIGALDVDAGLVLRALYEDRRQRERERHIQRFGG